MNRIVLGGVIALVMAAIGLFWWQGRAAVEQAAPPPEPVMAQPTGLPSADVAGLQGPTPPEATRLTREETRFFRYDFNRDRRITRDEMLSTRTADFRKLDKDGNNLLTFEEWAVTTVTRFEGADADANGELNAAEFATTAPKPAAPKPACRC